MKTFVISFSILASMLFHFTLAAQPIISYTDELKNGFTATVSLHEEHVTQVYSVYKEIKQKDSEIDIVVYELFRAGLIVVFKKNPEKTAKVLKQLRFAVPGAQIVANFFNKKNEKAARKAKIEVYSKQLIDEILTTIMQEKILAQSTAANY